MPFKRVYTWFEGIPFFADADELTDEIHVVGGVFTLKGVTSAQMHASLVKLIHLAVSEESNEARCSYTKVR